MSIMTLDLLQRLTEPRFGVKERLSLNNVMKYGATCIDLVELVKPSEHNWSASLNQDWMLHCVILIDHFTLHLTLIE